MQQDDTIWNPEGFALTTEKWPKGYRPYFPQWLYHHRGHLALQGRGTPLRFSLLDHAQQRVRAIIHFFDGAGEALSPYRSPFGSLAFDEALPMPVMHSFMEQVTKALHHRGNHTIFIKHHPHAYAPVQSTWLANSLLNLGYQIETAELNHHIPVTRAPFAEGLHAMERRRLAKAEKAGFSFRLMGDDELDEAHAFVVVCRKEKGHAPPISLDQLWHTRASFPAQLPLFGVWLGNDLAAVLQAIAVSSKVLYYFLPASATAFNAYSPMVLLLRHVYEYAQAQGFTLLDLGTSALEGRPNFPLIRFKEHLGGQVSHKLSFIKGLT